MMKNQPESDIIFRYIKGTANQEESKYIETWMVEDASNEDFILSLSKLYFAYCTKERILERDPYLSFEKFQNKLYARQIRFALRSIGRVAAVLLAIAMLSYFSLQSDFVREIFIKPQLITVEANHGMRTDFYLPDGTHVWLSSGSKLNYHIPFNRKKQEIHVVGQAYFEVAHDPDKPFLVNANDELKIHVLGTKFNVQAYSKEDAIKISLTEGRVSVSPYKDVEETFNCVMEVNEEFVYNRANRKYTVNGEQNIAPSIAWVEGKFIFKNTLMPEVFKQLEHSFNVKIIIEDSEIQQYDFTGVFENKSLSQILRYIEATSNLKYETHFMAIDDTLGENKEYIYIRQTK